MMGTASTSGLAQASVRIEPANLHGSRVLPEQTASAAVRDYLLAWQSLQAAFEQNRPEMLDIGFVGIAKDKLAAVIARQAELKLRTRYLDPAHDIQLVLYSPEGLSIELTDKVTYDFVLLDHEQVKTTQRIVSRYVIVLTPTETRWKVRVFQSDAN